MVDIDRRGSGIHDNNGVELQSSTLAESQLTGGALRFTASVETIQRLIFKADEIIGGIIAASGYRMTVTPQWEQTRQDGSGWRIALGQVIYPFESGRYPTYASTPIDLDVDGIRKNALKERDTINTVNLLTVMHDWLNQAREQVSPPTEDELKRFISTILAASINELTHYLSIEASDFKHASDPRDLEFASSAARQVHDLRTQLKKSKLTPYIFSAQAFRSSVFEIDEASLFLRQTERIKKLSCPGRLELAAKNAIEVGRHVRALILRTSYDDDKAILAYQSSEGIGAASAAMNSVDYALLISYLTPLLEEFKLQRQGQRQNIAPGRLLEAIYAGLSADPDLLCSRKHLEEMRITPIPLVSESDLRFYIDRMPAEDLDRYFYLLEENAGMLADSIASCDTFNPSTSKCGWHIGSVEASTYSIEMACLRMFLLSGIVASVDDYHRASSNEHFPRKRSLCDAIENSSARLYERATKFLQLSGQVFPSRNENREWSSLDRAKVARDKTICCLYQLSGNGSLAEVGSTVLEGDALPLPSGLAMAYQMNQPLQSLKVTRYQSPRDTLAQKLLGQIHYTEFTSSEVEAGIDDAEIMFSGFGIATSTMQPFLQRKAILFVCGALRNHPELATTNLAIKAVYFLERTENPDIAFIIDSCTLANPQCLVSIAAPLSMLLTSQNARLSSRVSHLMGTIDFGEKLMSMSEPLFAYYLNALHTKLGQTVSSPDISCDWSLISLVVCLPAGTYLRYPEIFRAAATICRSVPERHDDWEYFQDSLEFLEALMTVDTH